MIRVKCFVISLLSCFFAHAQQPAFPGAEGFGKFATGGRLGSVYKVTNLNDSGSGSLRDAVSQPNRIVVFEVAGVIKLNSALVFKPNQYIAGQTAPGEGITVYGNRVSFSGANHTICRYMKFRMGAKYGDSGKDACGISNGSDMIFDHCSISWGRDETFSVSWDGKGTEPTNITIQNCIIAQGLMSHSAGGLIQTNGGVTLYRNLYVDNDTRNNKIKGVNQYVNNMVYNWKSAAYIMGGDSEGQSYANCVGNYFIKGPGNGSTPLSGANSLFHIYAADNWFDANRNGVLDGYLVPQSEYSGGPDFKTTAFAYPELPTLTATALYANLIPMVGASLPCRDFVDYYLIGELQSFGTEGKIITSEEELPFGPPDTWSLWTGTRRIDTDNDGIPDEWETANSLNPTLASDAMAIATNGYTNIENYLNSIDPSSSQPYLRKPLNIRLLSATQNSVTLEWYDYTDGESGFVVERKIEGIFTPIGTAPANTDTFRVNGLQPEETGVYRIKAFNSTLMSEYSSEITVKSKPVPIPVLDLTSYLPDLTWTGSVDTLWNNESLNWKDHNGQAKFQDGKKVLFGNGIKSRTLTLNEKIAPSELVVSSDSAYIFTGNGEIGGTTSLNKAGKGTLSLLTNNSYSGATVMHGGTLEINKLANGGLPSSIGASQNYDFNWVWKGGLINYTGPTVSTDRNIALEENTSISVVNNSSVLTFTGTIQGSGGLTKEGEGTLMLLNANTYAGATYVKKGTLEINGEKALLNGLGTSNKIVLGGGRLKTSGGNISNYETYSFDIEVESEGKSSLEFFRNCYIKSKVSGQGELNFNIYYVREYIQGDWSQFSGTLFANGLGTTSDGNQLLLNNANGLPNARVVTSGNTKIVCWKNASTLYLGGLSGPAGTYLSGADKQNNAATMTWIVGGAGTDETFNGIINNECSNKNYKGATSIVKEGKGIWRLNGNNLYSGTTRVADGTLILNGNQSGTGKVSVEGGTLAGKGKVAGAVEVKTDAVLSPGDASIATFSAGSLILDEGSRVDIEINKTNNHCDKVASTGPITYNGTLKLDVTGTLMAGDQFTLFTGSTHTGSFSEIIPATPGNGLVWSFNKGILSVAYPSAVIPKKINSFNLSPNPSTGRLDIRFDKEYQQIEILVKSTAGNTIGKVNARGIQHTFDLGHLPSGPYFIEAIADRKKLPVMRFLKL